MAKGGYQLIKRWIYTRSAYLFYMRFAVKRHGNAERYFLLGLSDELKQSYYDAGYDA
jgi:hypothetical protein